MNFSRPRYFSTDLKDALAHDWRGWHLSEKKDGVWHVQQFNGSTLTCEKMRDGSLYVFDVTQVQGEDVRRCVWRDRREALIVLAQHFPAGWQIAPEGVGSEFIEAVIRSGGEGIVAKNWESYFGLGWHKAKKIITLDCTVAEIHERKSSVRLELDGEDVGWLKVHQPVTIGTIVEVVAYGRHASGKLREGRMIRRRDDKQTTGGDSVVGIIEL